MPEDYSLIVRNARLRYRPPERTFDVGIEGGLIAEISDRLSGKGEIELDAEGRLMLEPFVNPYLHLTTAYTYSGEGEDLTRLYMSEDMGGVLRAYEILKDILYRGLGGEPAERFRRALKDSLAHGVLHVRAFVNVGGELGLNLLREASNVREEFKHIINVELTALSTDTYSEGGDPVKDLRKAVQEGADSLALVPWLELSDDLVRRHVDEGIELAKELGRKASFVCDEGRDPFLKSAIYVLESSLREGFRDFSIYHARSLAEYPSPTIMKIARLSKALGASYVIAPHTGPVNMPYRTFLRAGVNVALGQGRISDPYYPFGSGNMLEIVYLAAHIFRSLGMRELEEFLDMISWRAAKVLGLRYCGLREGCPSDFVIADGKTIHEVISRHLPTKYVVKDGKIVSASRNKVNVYL